MQEHEAEQVWELLSAAFPWQELPAATLDLWLERLARMELETAMDAANAVVDTEDRFPPIACFLRAYDLARRNRQDADAGRRAMLAVVPDGAPSEPARFAPPPPEFQALRRRLVATVALPDGAL